MRLWRKARFVSMVRDRLEPKLMQNIGHIFRTVKPFSRKLVDCDTVFLVGDNGSGCEAKAIGT
jgi:hypothetical protein